MDNLAVEFFPFWADVWSPWRTTPDGTDGHVQGLKASGDPYSAFLVAGHNACTHLLSYWLVCHAVLVIFLLGGVTVKLGISVLCFRNYTI